MKKIYLVLIGCVVTILLNATPQSQTMSNFEKYERYFDSIDNLPYGNYFTIQPGLFNISNQMSEEYGSMRRKKHTIGGISAYPTLLNANVPEKYLNRIDTFRFNWHCDTILCKNYSRDDNGDFRHNCELVSSFDSVKVYDLDNEPYFTHGFYMDDRYKDTYVRAIRLWDEKLLDNIFLPDSGHLTSEFLVISRLVIEDGKLIDVKSMGSYGVREPYSVLP